MISVLPQVCHHNGMHAPFRISSRISLTVLAAPQPKAVRTWRFWLVKDALTAINWGLICPGSAAISSGRGRHQRPLVGRQAATKGAVSVNLKDRPQ